MKIAGCRVLVTGAGRRLGKAIALCLAEGGAEVIFHMHSSTEDEVLRELERMGRRGHVIHADLSLSGGGERLAMEVLERTGGIDVLVNSAAIFSPMTLLSSNVDEWRRTMRVNMSAPMALAMTLGQAMKEGQGRGKIIQLGDWSGQRPIRNYVPYCVAKSGMHLSTIALAKALAPEVQVNEVVLGPILPPEDYDVARLAELKIATPLRRLGTPDDVLRWVRFLVESSDFVTGAAYVVDGGWLAQGPGGMETSL